MARLPYKPGRDQVTFPTLTLAQKNPALAAAVAKSVRGQTPTQHDSKGKRQPVAMPYVTRQISQRRAKKNADAIQTLKVLPDLRLCADILVSSVLSPKDMTSTELLYKLPEGTLAPELHAKVLELLKTELEKRHDLKTRVPEALREALFDYGSYPMLVLPENAIDEMINRNRRVSLEGLSDYYDAKTGEVKPLGFLANEPAQSKGTGFKAALESFATGRAALGYDPKLKIKLGNESVHTEPTVTVVDNPAAMRLGALTQMLREINNRSLYQTAGFGTALESFDNAISDYMVDRSIMRRPVATAALTDSVPNQFELRRKSVGEPLVLKLPSEAVIPVYVPGDPKTHVGYYIALDEEGNPLRLTEQMGTIAFGGNTQTGLSTAITQYVAKQLGNGGQFDATNSLHVQMAYQMYADAVERDLVARVKNSGMVANAAISNNVEIYRLMLSRTFANQHTQLLYVPKEYLSYIALMFGDDGIGESLLDQQSQLNALRVTLLFADVINSVRNAIGRTKVTMKIDPDDATPENTIEMAMEEIIRSRTLSLPTGMNDPNDIMRFLQKAGYEWDIQNHPGLPDTTFDFTQTQSNYPKIDVDLTKSLRDQSIQAFGLTPEMVDQGASGPEFATSIVQNNILLAKRVIVLQDKFTPKLSDFLRKLAAADAGVVEALKEMLEREFDKIVLKVEDLLHSEDTAAKLDDDTSKKVVVSYVLQVIMNSFYVELPRPSSVTSESQKSDLQNYTDLIDAALDSYINDDMFNEATVGKLSENVGTMKAAYKAYFVRAYMAEHGITPEVAGLLSIDDKQGSIDNDILESITQHMTTLARGAVKALSFLTKNAQAVTQDLEKNDVAEGAASTGSTSTGGSDSGGDDGLGGFDFGDDDLGSDLDTPPPDEPITGDSADKPASADTPEDGNASKDTTATGTDEAPKE